MCCSFPCIYKSASCYIDKDLKQVLTTVFNIMVSEVRVGPVLLLVYSA